MTTRETFYNLDADPSLRRHIAKERERARKLRKTPWWRELIAKGLCHYCRQTVPSADLTMDHIVPLARNGTSTKGNVVPACRACNQRKQLNTPVETLLDQLKPAKD